MGLNLRFFQHPSPLGWGADVADDRVAALGDVDVLNGHLLLATTSISFQRLNLGCERARELVEGALAESCCGMFST
jgi:hypothetical protein